MAKRKNNEAPPPPPGAGEVVDPQAVEIAETETTTVAGRVSIEFPTLLLDWGFVMPRHDVKLTRSQAETWRSITEGLQQQEQRLENGKYVRTITDAIRWTAENVTTQEGK